MRLKFSKCYLFEDNQTHSIIALELWAPLLTPFMVKTIFFENLFNNSEVNRGVLMHIENSEYPDRHIFSGMEFNL